MAALENSWSWNWAEVSFLAKGSLCQTDSKSERNDHKLIDREQILRLKQYFSGGLAWPGKLYQKTGIVRGVVYSFVYHIDSMETSFNTQSKQATTGKGMAINV